MIGCLVDLLSEARAHLKAWHDRARLSRRGPGWLEIASVDRVELTQVEVITRSQRRTLHFRSTRREGEARPAARWDVDFGQEPVALPDGFVDERELPHVVQKLCLGCVGGLADCPHCRELRRSAAEGQVVDCAHCRGEGDVRCETCGGRGHELARATVRLEILRHERRSVIDEHGIPNEMFLDFQDRSFDGETILDRAFELGQTVHLSAGYREAAVASDGVNRWLRGLELADEFGSEERFLERHLRIRHVAVLRVNPEQGESLWLWGSPPEVAPSRVLEWASLLDDK